MNRERRFEQKQNVRIKRFKRIWNDLSNWEIAGGHWNGWSGDWVPDHRNRLEKHWRTYATGVNYSAVPGWWNRLYHSRPNRINARRVAYSIVRGRDSDTIEWPHNRRPTIYYW